MQAGRCKYSVTAIYSLRLTEFPSTTVFINIICLEIRRYVCLELRNGRIMLVLGYFALLLCFFLLNFQNNNCIFFVRIIGFLGRKRLFGSVGRLVGRSVIIPQMGASYTSMSNWIFISILISDQGDVKKADGKSITRLTNIARASIGKVHKYCKTAKLRKTERRNEYSCSLR